MTKPIARAFEKPMPISFDVSHCLKQAKEFLELANTAANPELRANYLELAKHYTQLAGLIQRADELDSNQDKPRREP